MFRFAKAFNNPAIVAAVIVIAVLAIAQLITGDLVDGWLFLGVAGMNPYFADLRVLANGIDCAAMGRDGSLDIGCDEWGRPLNYPSFWLAMGHLGLSGQTNNIFGFIIFAAVFTCFARLYNAQGRAAWLLFLAFCLSPPVMLLVERGNVDGIIFSLCVAGLAYAAYSTRSGRSIVFWGCLWFTAMMKIYPAAPMMYFAIQRKRFLLGLALAAALSIVMILWARLDVVFAATPQDCQISFGASAIMVCIAERMATLERPFLSPDAVRLLTVGAAAIAGGAMALWGVLSAKSLPSWFAPDPDMLRADASPRARLDMTLCLWSASIFCFVYLLGANYDYRMTFLMPIYLYWCRAISKHGVMPLIVPCVLLGAQFAEAYLPLPLDPGRLRNYVQAILMLISDVLIGGLFLMLARWLGQSLPVFGGLPFLTSKEPARSPPSTDVSLA